MKAEIIKDWKTKSGLRAVVNKHRHFCGYVGIPKGHPLYGRSYSEHIDALKDLWEKAKQGEIGKRGVIPLFCAKEDTASMDIVFDVHGSVTFSRTSKDYPVKSKLHWIGFGCGHSGDHMEFEGMECINCKYDKCKKWTPEEVAEECESLAEQIKMIS